MNSKTKKLVNNKEFIYHLPKKTLIDSVVSVGICVIGTLLAYFANSAFFFWAGVFISVFMILTASINFRVNYRNDIKLIITDEGIFIPSIWRLSSINFVRFSEIKKINMQYIQNIRILRLQSSIKSYSINSLHLSKSNDFDEVVELVTSKLS